MFKQIEKYEFAIFVAAICMISAGILGFYVKIFNMAPPLPVEVIHLPILCGMALTIILRLRESVFGLLSIFPYFVLMLLAVASFKWSQQPELTLRDSIMAMIYVLYLATMCWCYSWKKLIEGMWIALFGMTIVSILLYFGVPGVGRMAETHIGAMSGVWIEKNAAGQAGVFGAILALARIAISPKTFVSSMVSFFAFTLLLLLTTSKTSLVAYLIGCAGFGWVFMMRRSLPIAMATLWSSIVIGGLAISWVRGNVAEVLGLLGKSATFTGRSEIWQAVEISLARRPLLGHGFSGYWDEVVYGKTLAYVYDDLQFLPRHSHNSLIEMKLNLGLIGAGLMVGSIALYLVISLMKTRKSHGAYFAIPFTAAAIIIGIFESVLANPSNFAGAAIILVAAKMTRPVLLSEMQSGFWMTVNGLRTQGEGPRKRKLYPVAAPQKSSIPQRPGLSLSEPAPRPAIRTPQRRATDPKPTQFGPAELGFIDRRKSRARTFTDRRRPGGPMTAAKIQGRLLARRRGERPMPA